jgi:hypothetical protein
VDVAGRRAAGVEEIDLKDQRVKSVLVVEQILQRRV